MKIIYIACILVLIALMLVAFYYFMDLNRQNYTAFDKGILKNSDNKTFYTTKSATEKWLNVISKEKLKTTTFSKTNSEPSQNITEKKTY